jgi:hypothetical protein
LEHLGYFEAHLWLLLRFWFIVAPLWAHLWSIFGLTFGGKNKNRLRANLATDPSKNAVPGANNVGWHPDL